MRKKLPQRLLRELAKVLKVSQPTITRARHKLERNGMIEDYTIIPNFRKMGFEILALTFVKMRSDLLMGETKENTKKMPQSFLM